MKNLIAIVIGFCILCVLMSGCLPNLGSDDDHVKEPSTPEQIIAQYANKETAPLWQIPLGRVYVDDMQLIARDKLLIGLKDNTTGLPNRETVLVDLSIGKILWRYERNENGSYYLLLTLDGTILFQVSDESKQSLITLDQSTGIIRWQREFDEEYVRFYPVSSDSKILVDKRDGKKIELFALDLTDGRIVWSRQFVLKDKDDPPSGILVENGEVWDFFDGTERISIEDGSTLWSRKDITVVESDPPQQLDGDKLYIAHNRTLLSVDAVTGTTLWSSRLNMYPTNIYPLGKLTLVRGELPFKDPLGNFSFKLPKGWEPDKKISPPAYNFRDDYTGAAITIGYCQNAELKKIFNELHTKVMNTFSVVGSPDLRSEMDKTIDGNLMHLSEYSVKIKKNDSEKSFVFYIGAVVDEHTNSGAGFVATVPAQSYQSVNKDILRSFETLRPSQSVAETWAQRTNTEGSGSFQISAFNTNDGTSLWNFNTRQPTLSNFLEVNKRLYVATSSSLYSINSFSGQKNFESETTNTGRNFPVHLRIYGNKVVFISELIIAAYDSESGAVIYNHGITPISQETELTGLDNSIDYFREKFSVASSAKPHTDNFWSDYASEEALRYQNLADKYSNKIKEMRSSGRDSRLAEAQLRMNRNMAEFETNVALIQSLFSLGASLIQSLKIVAWQKRYEDLLARQMLFRNSIISAYSRAESDDFVYRPNRVINKSQNADFTTITVVHLPTGQRRTTVLSPTYMNYGLWNFVDTKKGIVYHHGVGLDTSRYVYGESEKVGILGNVKTLNTFLIAQPIKMPR